MTLTQRKGKLMYTLDTLVVALNDAISDTRQTEFPLVRQAGERQFRELATVHNVKALVNSVDLGDFLTVINSLPAVVAKKLTDFVVKVRKTPDSDPVPVGAREFDRIVTVDVIVLLLGTLKTIEVEHERSLRLLEQAA